MVIDSKLSPIRDMFDEYHLINDSDLRLAVGKNVKAGEAFKGNKGKCLRVKGTNT